MRKFTFLILIVLFSFSCDEYNDEKVIIKATAINEECDEYNHLWEIDSVSTISENVNLIGELLYSKEVSIYLINNNLDTEIRNEKLYITGKLSRSPKMEHYTCRETWFIRADSFNVLTK